MDDKKEPYEPDEERMFVDILYGKNPEECSAVTDERDLKRWNEIAADINKARAEHPGMVIDMPYSGPRFTDEDTKHIQEVGAKYLAWCETDEGKAHNARARALALGEPVPNLGPTAAPAALEP